MHAACPCDKLSQMAPHPGQANFSQVEFDRSEGMVKFSFQVIEDRVVAGGGGSAENPKGSRFWKLPVTLRTCGTKEAPKKGYYFATPDLCAYGAEEPARYDKVVEARRKVWRDQLADPAEVWS